MRRSATAINGQLHGRVLQARLLVALVAGLAQVHRVAAAGECSRSSPCPDSYNCCSQFGYCGTSDAFCGYGCIVGPCTGGGVGGTLLTLPTAGGQGWTSFFTKSDFNNWFPDRDSFYTYEAFEAATAAYPSFGNSGSTDDMKREIAAFFGNVRQESAGLRYIEEFHPASSFCNSASTRFPCAPGKRYFGRGPIQLSWNFNYGECGEALNLDLLANPDQVARNASTAFKTALWFWMTNGCQGAIVGPPPSFANTIKIFNGVFECGHGFDWRVENRVNAYVDFCRKLGVDPGNNLRC